MNTKQEDVIIELTSKLEPCPYCGFAPMVSLHQTPTPNFHRVQIDCSNGHCASGINQFVYFNPDGNFPYDDVISAWHDFCIEIKEVKELIDF